MKRRRPSTSFTTIPIRSRALPLVAVAVAVALTFAVTVRHLALVHTPPACAPPPVSLAHFAPVPTRLKDSVLLVVPLDAPGAAPSLCVLAIHLVQLPIHGP